MRAHVPASVSAGGITLEKGDYAVVVDEQSHSVLMSRGAFAARLPALERASKVQVRKLRAELRPVPGEDRWLLVVRTPPAREWVVSLRRAGV